VSLTWRSRAGDLLTIGEHSMTDEPTPATEPADTAEIEAAAPAVEDDLLVEDVSIDGMCGVY
jgi:mycofactocin precursor